MNTSFISKRSGWCAACALTLGFAFAPAQAADMAPGASIWKNSHGEWCWNREFIRAIPPSGCGPQLVAQPVASPAFVAPARAAVQARSAAPVQPAPPSTATPR